MSSDQDASRRPAHRPREAPPAATGDAVDPPDELGDRGARGPAGNGARGARRRAGHGEPTSAAAEKQDDPVRQPDGQEPGPAVATPAQHPTTPADQVARAALARAQEAARARGLRPGDAPRRRAAGPTATAAGPDARDPQPVGVTAGRLAAELGWRPGLVEGDLRGRWPELVGPDIAEHCRPETFDAGLLTLRASSTAWATTLTLEAQRLLGRLAEELGEGVVVEVKVLGPAGPGFGRGRRSVPGRGARDTWG